MPGLINMHAHLTLANDNAAFVPYMDAHSDVALALRAAHNAKLITDENHQKYKQQILLLLNAGDDLTQALRDWDPSKPVPAIAMPPGATELNVMPSRTR